MKTVDTPQSAAEFVEQALEGKFDKPDTEGLPEGSKKHFWSMAQEKDLDRALELAVQERLSGMNRHQRRAWIARQSRAVGKKRAKLLQAKAAP